MDRREFLERIGTLAKSAAIARVATSSLGTLLISSCGSNPLPNNVQQLINMDTGKEKKLEFFVNSHNNITQAYDIARRISPNAISEIDFYIWAQDKGVTKFYVEGMPDGKTPSDPIEVLVPNEKEPRTIIYDDVMVRAPLISTIRLIDSRDGRYDFARENIVNFLALMQSGAYIAREVLGYKEIQIQGIENWDLYNKSGELDQVLGLEENIQSSFRFNMNELRMIVDIEGDLSRFNPGQKEELRNYIDGGLKDIEAYIKIHELREISFVSNAISDLIRSTDTKAIASVGMNHYQEITTALMKNNKIDFAIYAPVDIVVRDQTIKEFYTPLIDEVTELKKLLN